MNWPLAILGLIILAFVFYTLFYTERFSDVDSQIGASIYDSANAQQAEVEQETSIFNSIKRYFSTVWNRSNVTYGRIDNSVVSMDSALTPDQVQLVEISAANLTKGSCVDLYKLTGNAYLKNRGFDEGEFHDAQYCIDNNADTTVDVCSIGRFVFSKGRKCWVFQGNLSDLRKDIDPEEFKKQWLLRPEAQQGSNNKSPLETCPFSPQHCPALMTYFSDGLRGYKSFPDGAMYEYDGTYVRRIL